MPLEAFGSAAGTVSGGVGAGWRHLACVSSPALVLRTRSAAAPGPRLMGDTVANPVVAPQLLAWIATGATWLVAVEPQRRLAAGSAAPRQHGATVAGGAALQAAGAMVLPESVHSAGRHVCRAAPAAATQTEVQSP